MIYMNVKCDDLIANGVVSSEDLEWVRNVRIPYPDPDGVSFERWYRKHIIDFAIVKAVKDGVVNFIEHEIVLPKKGPYIISDYIAGPGGALQNHADGKMYDSKSQYYRAVKAAGCEVLGTDAPTEAKPIEANICEKELKRDIAEAIQQLGG